LGSKEIRTCIGNPHKGEEFLIKEGKVEIEINPGFNATDDERQKNNKS